MRILIIEDEPLAAERLEELVLRYESHWEIKGPLDSVTDAVAWFRQNPSPDLLFLDIHLADGLCFEIFDQVQVTCPVIFTTAYDAYALKAFKLNSVDYLLKPLDYEELASAMDKFVKVHLKGASNKMMELDLEAIRQALVAPAKAYKSRFVVKRGEHLHSIPIEEILYFYSEEKVSFLRTYDNERYIVDYTLGELEEKVNPDQFFRLNRQYLCRHEAITDIISFSNRRLKVKIQHTKDENILVSREKVAAFKQWLDN